MDTFFVTIDWLGAVLTVVAGGFVGLQLASMAARGSDRATRASTSRSGLLLIIVAVFVLLGVYLDDGPVLEPWWLQLMLLFGVPLLVTLAVKVLANTRRTT